MRPLPALDWIMTTVIKLKYKSSAAFYETARSSTLIHHSFLSWTWILYIFLRLSRFQTREDSIKKKRKQLRKKRIGKKGERKRKFSASEPFLDWSVSKNNDAIFLFVLALVAEIPRNETVRWSNLIEKFYWMDHSHGFKFGMRTRPLASRPYYIRAYSL